MLFLPRSNRYGYGYDNGSIRTARAASKRVQYPPPPTTPVGLLRELSFGNLDPPHPCVRPSIPRHVFSDAKQGLQYLLLLEALLVSAVVIYGALFWLVMPLRLHDKPIFFDYSNRSAATVRVGDVFVRF